MSRGMLLHMVLMATSPTLNLTTASQQEHFHFVGRTAGMYRPHHGMFRSVTLLIKALGSHDD